MKDDIWTPTPDGDCSPNNFERAKAGTAARDDAEAAIENLRQRGGVFVEAVRATRMPMLLTDPTLPGNPIVFANPSFLKLSGYSMDEVLGQKPHFMNGAGTDPKDAARFEEAIRADQDDIIETVQYRKDGSRFIATVLISAFKDDEGQTVNHFMSWLDVTRRVDAEDEVADLRHAQLALNEELANTKILQDLGSRLASEDDLQTIYEEILTAAISITDASAGSVQMLDPNTDELVILAARGFGEETMQYFCRVNARSNTSCGAALRSGERTYFNFDPAGTDKSTRLHVEDGVLSAQSTPLVSRSGRPIGMVSTHWGEPDHRMSERQLRYLDLLARQAADLLKQRIVQNELRESEERFRLAIEGSKIALYECDTDLRYTWIANPAEGFKPSDIIGKTDPELLEAEDARRLEAFKRRALASDEPIEEELAGSPGGTHRWFLMRAEQLRDSDGNKNGLRVLALDITAPKLVEHSLRESEGRLAAAFESVPAGLAVLGLDGRAIIANAEFRRFLPNETVPSRDQERGDRWQAWDDDGRLLKPKDWPSARALRGESVLPGQEMLFTDDEGRKIWTNVATAPTFDEAGNVTGVLSVISDIDKRKQGEEALRRSERHAQMLLAELQHRVRNTLAVVRAIARRTAENTTTAEEMLAHFQGRIDAFSRVQAAVTRSAEGKVDLTSLIEDEFVAHAARDGQQLKIDGPKISLPPKTAERLSLAIHELTTNAVKHGALCSGNGKILVRWTREAGANGTDQLTLSWKEQGVVMNGRRHGREGFGMELLRRSLPYDLQGETEVELEPDGLRFELRMPLPA